MLNGLLQVPGEQVTTLQSPVVVYTAMPGLLKDPLRRGDNMTSHTDEEDSPTSGASEMEECLRSQQWMVRRYQHLRRELEAVDRQLETLKINVERRKRERDELLNSLESKDAPA